MTKARDLADTAGVSVTLDDIRTPTITSPTEGSIVNSFNPEIVGTAYAPLYSADARNYRQFQVDVAAGDFSAPVTDEQANTDSRTLATQLASSTAYKARIRDVPTIAAASDWSIVVAFSTPAVMVNAPTLTVEGAPSSVDKSPTLTTSAFSTTPPNGDTHAATDWEIRKTSDNSLVYSSLNDATNLLSIRVPPGNLEVSTEYLFRARHIGATFGPGLYAEVTATTVAVFSVVPLLAVSMTSSPFITIYDQEIDTFTKLADPATLPTGLSTGVAFSGDDLYMAVGHYATPFVSIYKRSNDTFTKLANPATLPNQITNLAFSSDATYLAASMISSPFVIIYKRSGDTFTKLANPATLPPGAGTGLALSSDGIYMAVSHLDSPFVSIYKRTGDVFSKLGNPIIQPTGTGRGVGISSDATYLAVGHSNSPFVSIYKRSGDTFTKLANPATLTTGQGNGFAFSSDDLYMAVAHGGSPFVSIYKRSGDTFTKLANPATLPAGNGNGVAFSSDDLYMAVAHGGSPYITIYKRSGDTFTKLADPATLPTDTGNRVAFSNTGFPQT